MHKTTLAPYNQNNSLVISDKDQFWDLFLHSIRNEFGPAIFENWLSELKFVKMQSNILVVGAPNKFIREWVIANYFSRIKNIVEKIDKNIKRIDIILQDLDHQKEDVSMHKHQGREVNNEQYKEKILENSFSSNLNSLYNFDKFIVGLSNKIAYAAAQQISKCTSLDKSHSFNENNALYIHSSVGMGKTHLLHAIAQQIKKNYPNKKVAYMSAEKFMHRYIMSIKANELLTFREKLRSLDILLLDDLQFICDKTSTQKEFSNTLNALIEGGKKIVISCDRSPYLLNIDARTKSRLTGFSVVEIGLADFNLRLKILNGKASCVTTKVEDKILKFIASNVSSSIREVEGALNRIITHCSLNDSEITMEMSKNILRDCLKAHEAEISVDKIISMVADNQGVQKSDILSKSRLSNLVFSRQMVAYLAKSLTKYSLQDIGRQLGNKDHATIIYYIRQFELKIERKQQIMDEINKIKDKIRACNSIQTTATR